MSMVIKNNMPAVMTLGTLNHNSMELSKSLQKVSSGMKINSAADDASGYAISERMRVQIRGLDQANLNTQNGISMLKVAEGAVSSTVDILKTLKEKVINAANDTNTDADRQIIQKELDQSIDQINDNANITYNGKYLVDGSKNAKGEATYTALTNTMLSPDTQTGTPLTDLKNRNGDNLGILSTDEITVSYVQEGKTYTTSFSVGTACLHDIFSNAEVVDSRSQTFADQTNSSVGAAAGLGTSEELAQRRQTLYDAWQSAETALTSAQNAYNTQQAIVNNAQAAVAAAQQTLDNLTNLQSTMISTFNTLSSSVDSNNDSVTWKTQYGSTTTSPKDAIQEGFKKWKESGTDSGIAAYPSPGKLDTSEPQNNFYHTVNEHWADGYHPTTSITNIVDSYKTYSNAYNAFSNAGGDTALANAQTALPNAQNTLAAAQSSLATKQSELSTAQSAATTARNNYYALFGPYLLDKEKVGLDRFGNTVTTANGENAITVTANAGGLQGQIAGLTISVTDSQGNVKKSVNSVLDAFNESIRAEEASEENAIVLQTGTKANQSIKIGLSDMRARALGLQGSDGSTLNIGTQKNANAAINVLDNAVQKALDQQTTIGSIQSRLEYTSANLTTATENVQASESTIRDANMPKEMMEFTKNNILTQATQAMLAQANQSSSDVLSLLR